MNFFHSDRASFQLSVVHGAPGPTVQFVSYFEISWPIGEGERDVPLSHFLGQGSGSCTQLHIDTHSKNVVFLLTSEGPIEGAKLPVVNCNVYA